MLKYVGKSKCKVLANQISIRCILIFSVSDAAFIREQRLFQNHIS